MFILIQTITALDRIKTFLTSEEIDPTVVSCNPDEGIKTCSQLFVFKDFFKKCFYYFYHSGFYFGNLKSQYLIKSMIAKIFFIIINVMLIISKHINCQHFKISIYTDISH